MTQLAAADSPALLDDPLPVDQAKPVARRWLHRAAGWTLFAAIVAAALVAGLILRRWAWDQTEPIRYTMDIDNAYRQGTNALRIGYIDRYDERETQPGTPGGLLDLDYGPGRLAVATLWTRWVRSQFPTPMTDFKKLVPTGGPNMQFYAYARSVHRQYELIKPMLMLNLTGEILTAIAMFFLVRRYTSGKSPDQPVVVGVYVQAVSVLLLFIASLGLITGLFAHGGWYQSIGGLCAVAIAFGGVAILLPRGTFLGLVAALFFWLDPALIWNAHCWPQWDSWVLPFFLWAVLLASLDWWFCAGVLIATGAMFKGQILFGAPVFVLWPLFQGRLPAVSRWLVGLFTATALITAVWLVRIPGTHPTGGKFIPGSVNPHAIAWLIYLALIFAAMTAVLWWPKHPIARVPVAMMLAAVFMWLIGSHTTQTFSVVGFIVLTAAAWFVDRECAKWSWHAKLPLGWLAVALLIYPLFVLARDWIVLVVIATVAMGTLLAVAPRKVLTYAAAAWMSAALLLCIPVFGAGTGWWDLGFAYGTHHFEKMTHGELENLPELLQQGWGWDDLMAPAVTLTPGPTANHVAAFLTAIDPGVKIHPGDEINLPLKYFLVSAWLIAVVICAIGVAIHDRNRSPRFLIAIAAPWIAFFAVMTQMHQRYLMWGGSLSAASAVLSPGYALLHFFLSVVSVSQEMQSMMNNVYDPTNHGQFTHYPAYTFVEAWHPGIAWAVLLTAGIFVYSAVKWDRPKKKPVKVGKLRP